MKNIILNTAMLAVSFSVIFAKAVFLPSSLLLDAFYASLVWVPQSVLLDVLLSGFAFYVSTLPLIAWKSSQFEKHQSTYGNVLWGWMRDIFKLIVPLTRESQAVLLVSFLWHVPIVYAFGSVAQSHLFSVWQMAVAALKERSIYAIKSLISFDFKAFGWGVANIIHHLGVAVLHTVRIIGVLVFNVVSYALYSVVSALLYAIQVAFEAIAVAVALMLSGMTTLFYRQDAQLDKSLFQKPIFYVFFSMFLLGFNSVSLGSTAINLNTAWVLFSWMSCYFTEKDTSIFSDISMFQLASSSAVSVVSLVAGMPAPFVYTVTLLVPHVITQWARESKAFQTTFETMDVEVSDKVKSSVFYQEFVKGAANVSKNSPKPVRELLAHFIGQGAQSSAVK